ncbi:MAG: PIF1 family DEAD/DEAH box helicase [Rhodothermales bacterium]
MTQREALDILKTGVNVFLTGEPGSGKTHTIGQYIDWLKQHRKIAGITASTGIAATHLGGLTIHSWSGVGIKDRLTPRDLKAIKENKRLTDRAKKTHVLVIDEVSMLSADMLTSIDRACRVLRENAQPFGGLQVILVGDFYQLPPVQRRAPVPPPRTSEWDDMPGLFDNEPEAPPSIHAFASPAWDALELRVCYLHEQHRQADKTYLDVLTAIRSEQLYDEHYELLASRIVEHVSPGITKLYTHNADVDRQNMRALDLLATDTRIYRMETKGPQPVVAQMIRGCLSPEELVLKVGARVMFTRNDFQAGFVNGTTGVVVEFTADGPIVETEDGTYIEVESAEWRFESGEDSEEASLTQLPLRLAWAITIHKSQGMSLDRAHMDLSRTFEFGQGYVALSRLRSLQGLTLKGINERALRVHPEIVSRDLAFRRASERSEDWLHELGDEGLRRVHASFQQKT